MEELQGGLLGQAERPDVATNTAIIQFGGVASTFTTVEMQRNAALLALQQGEKKEYKVTKGQRTFTSPGFVVYCFNMLSHKQ